MDATVLGIVDSLFTQRVDCLPESEGCTYGHRHGFGEEYGLLMVRS